MTHVTFRKRRQRYGEKELENVVRTILEAVPEKRIDDLIRGRISRVDFTELVVSEMEEQRLELEEALYAIILFEVEETDDEVRDDINRNMRQLGSPVRLRKPKQVEKATVSTTSIEWASAAYDPFNVADPEAILRVQARQQAGEIFSHLAATERDMIIRQVELGFTQVQEFSTGRTVTGRTVQQTARGIFPILEATIPVVTPETAAIYRTQYTNGLFPRWANAVNNFADRTANQLTARNITGNRAAELLDNRTKRYGDKLRRSRARMIARTETSFAQNAARQVSYNTAIEGGLVPQTALKTWVTGGFDVCNICSPLSGQKVPLQSVFYWANGGGLHPPAHPNCRCKTRMAPNINQPPELMGIGTPADPFRYMFADGFTAGINPIAGVPQAYSVAATQAATQAARTAGATRAESTIRQRPTNHRSIEDEFIKPKTKAGKETTRTKEVVNPVTEKMSEIGLSVEPLVAGKTEILLAGKSKGDVAGFFSPAKRIKKPRKPRQPKKPANQTVEEYLESPAVQKYKDAVQKYKEERTAWYQADGYPRPVIQLVDDTIGSQQNTLAHEIGHRLDCVVDASGKKASYFADDAITAARQLSETVGTLTNPMAGLRSVELSALPAEHRAMFDLLRKAKDSDAIGALREVARRVYPSQSQYNTFIQYAEQPTELWARIFNQWFTQKHGTTTAIENMASTVASNTGYQWSVAEWNQLGFDDLVEEVLRTRGILP